jgi:3-oxoacyl-[acyl-carrier protein] reductase
MRRVIVTGASRRVGIGYAVARRLAADGADVVAQSWEPHDAEQPWGADPIGAAGVADALRAEVGAGAGRVEHVALDLGTADGPARLLDDARRLLGGPVDAIVACHARSSAGELADVTAEELDLCWAVNARSVVLLAQAAAAQPDVPADGRFVFFTSGQHHEPMPDELPYALSKAALAGIVPTLAAALAPLRWTVNCIDPGPTDTGYADRESHAIVAARMPWGRWGQPADVANLVAWLVGPEGSWMTGQLLVSDGGWTLRNAIPPSG